MTTNSTHQAEPLSSLAHPRAYWLGVAAVSVGVALHLPMFLGARDVHYRLSGMSMDTPMWVGMGFILIGLVAILRGVLHTGVTRFTPSSSVRLAIDEQAPISASHVRMIVALIFAIAIDSQKPFTFTFILPGVAKEYHLTTPVHHLAGHLPVALLPLAGIGCTVLGSLVWGWWADRVGRRAPTFAAAGLFIATAMCGAMPSYTLNVVMCALMGLAVGGLLPTAFSLLSETIPGSRRGQVIMLVAGLGTGLGFLLTSWLADWLIPTFGWRIMWLVGAPTGVALMLLNRYIPESPRFLIAHGRAAEAEAVLAQFGMRPPEVELIREPGPALGGGRSNRGIAIFCMLALFGLAWGLVNYGFLTWLPTRVRTADLSAGGVTTILAKGALFSTVGALVVAWLYGRWSSKWTLFVSGLGIVAALAAFAIAGRAIVHHHALFTALVVLLLTAMWAVGSALLLYAAEILPTRIRAGGGGFVAAMTKMGGVVAFTMAALTVAAPGISGAAIIAAVPTALAAVALAVVGRETRARSLEEISASLAPVAKVQNVP